MLTSEQLEAYRRDGVTPVGRVLDDATVAQANRRIEALREAGKLERLGAKRIDGKHSYRLLNVHTVDDWFYQTLQADPILDAAASILGPDIQFYQTNLFIKPPNEGSPTSWHQDNIWWHADPPNILTVWIALDDVTRESGAVQYVAGSHTHLVEGTIEVVGPGGGTYKVLSEDQVDMDRLVSFDVPAGHAVIHHCLTMHGALPNLSSRWRRGFTVHLMQAGILQGDYPLLRGAMPA